MPFDGSHRIPSGRLATFSGHPTTPLSGLAASCRCLSLNKASACSFASTAAGRWRLVAVGRDSAIERQLELEAVAERSGSSADRAAATSTAEGPGLATQGRRSSPAKQSFRPRVGYKTIRGSQPAAVPDQTHSRTHAFAVKPLPLHLQSEEAGRISGGEDAFAPVARSGHEAQKEAKEACSPQRGPATGRGLQRWPLQMTRFGRHVVWQANWRPGEFDKFQARLVAGNDEVTREIDRDIGDTAALVSQRRPEVVARPTGLPLSGHRGPMPTGAR